MSLISLRVDVVIDWLSNMVSVIVGATIGVFGDANVFVATSALIVLELVVPFSHAMEVMFDDWPEAAINIDVSIDRRVGKLISALARM